MSEDKQPFNLTRGPRRGGKSGRLPTLRPPRDLTLGGAVKKTFVPNIPVRRKIEEKPIVQDEGPQPETSTQKKREHFGAGHGSGAAMGRRHEKRKQNVVQTHSIFEQGPAERSHKASSGHVRYGNSERSSSATKKTVIKKERLQDQDNQELLDELRRDDFIVDDKFAGTDPLHAPICLPLSVKSEAKTESDVKPSVKSIKVKQEKDTTDMMLQDSDIPAVGDEVDIADENSTAHTRQPATCAELFCAPMKSDASQLLFIQLPDTLPGEPLSKPPEEKPKGEKQNLTETTPVEVSQMGLAEFGEGQIGKLQIHKSGRTRLVLGENSLDVTLGTPSTFLQELVSLQLEEKTGRLCVLGHVNHKLVCLPDMESLLDAR